MFFKHFKHSRPGLRCMTGQAWQYGRHGNMAEFAKVFFNKSEKEDDELHYMLVYETQTNTLKNKDISLEISTNNINRQTKEMKKGKKERKKERKKGRKKERKKERKKNIKRRYARPGF